MFIKKHIVLNYGGEIEFQSIILNPNIKIDEAKIRNNEDKFFMVGCC